ncbi:glycosyltransferase [Verrucomicrobiota bacterium]
MDKVRYNLVKTVQQAHGVTLLAPVTGDTPADAIEHVRGVCEELVAVNVTPVCRNQSKQVRSFLTRWLRAIFLRAPIYVTSSYSETLALAVRNLCSERTFDVLQATSDVTGCYLPQAGSSCITVVGPMDDTVESVRGDIVFSRSLKHKAGRWLEYRARKHYQPRMCRAADWCLFHAPEDMRRIAELSGGLPNARTLPVAVEPADDCGDPGEERSELEDNSVAFVGGMGSFFNVDAALHFCRDILPLIRESIPNVHVYLVGQNPPVEIKALVDPGRITVTGAVPDVRPFVRRAAAFVAPIRVGTGVKTKTIEALSLGKAIVTTDAGIHGLWDKGDGDMLVRNDAAGFAEAVTGLLRDRVKRESLEGRARGLFERSYRFEKVVPLTLGVYDEIERGIGG